ncbi:helix-turn-helix transcriptional regulator [Chthonobacter rhizosphaerae]|uniref:helix-turn-helix transcriptional regulator n=1 Tax=Chthonobacter rhizosphaerae TaxID=2735553 RepID=UPI0015EF4119|nr:helix-turn-helix transcriptional regulator [Chthonobacter rhizosphaerae]
MLSEEKLLALVDDFYTVSLDPRHWIQALHNFSRYFDGAGAVMHVYGNGRPDVFVSPDLQDAATAYTQYWWQEDPLVSYAQRVNLQERVWVDRQILSEDTIRTSAFYNDFLAKQGLGSIAGVLTKPFSDTFVNISLQSAPGFELEPDMQRIFGLLITHVRRAAALSAQIRALRAERDTLVAAFDRYRCAVALVRPDGSVLSSNDQARALAGRGLSLARGRLVVEGPAQQRALEAMIAGIANPAVRAGTGDVLFLKRQASPLPLMVRGVPVGPRQVERHLAGVEATHAVLLLIVDGELAGDGRQHQALRGLGLTPAQARMASLIGQGLSPAEIAASLGVSENTVRTTLKAIYAKLGVKRQAELVRLVDAYLPLG